MLNYCKKNQALPQNQEIKWNDALTTDLNWKKIYGQIINITIDTKLHSFQYKYLMHILPNNKQLFKYGMIESSLCDFCSMTTESMAIYIYFGNVPMFNLFGAKLGIFLMQNLTHPVKTS